MESFKKTEKQIQAIDLMSKYIECLFEGGSRSGKTFIEVYTEIVRGLAKPGTMHLCLRQHFNHAKISLGMQTIPSVFKIAFPKLKYKLNKTDYFFEFGEGSQIWIGGTDDKERIEKILGTEWATILLNEISQQSYNTYETLKTRLNPPRGMKPLFIMDQNPPSSSHWSYIRFHLELNPENKQPLSDRDKARQCFFKMNPVDNLQNLSEDYISTLESMSEAKKRRFLYGDYGDDSINALWRRAWITNNRVNKIPEGMYKIIVGVDPAVTDGENSDDTGIIVAGAIKINNEDHYYVLEDRTYHGGVNGWGEEVVAAYRKWRANKIIAETNNGGDLVEMNIRNYDRNIAYEGVHASRGKLIRAEPVSDLYRRGFVHHVGTFTELEDQMCTWTMESGDKSPNNMDALVWTIVSLAGLGGSGSLYDLIGGQI